MHPRRFGISTPAEVEVEEVTTPTETPEGALQDGPMKTTIRSGTTTDDRPQGLPAKGLPGADPPAEDLQETTRRQPSLVAHAAA